MRGYLIDKDGVLVNYVEYDKEDLRRHRIVQTPPPCGIISPQWTGSDWVEYVPKPRKWWNLSRPRPKPRFIRCRVCNKLRFEDKYDARDG